MHSSICGSPYSLATPQQFRTLSPWPAFPLFS
jgi:hypothetical protein